MRVICDNCGKVFSRSVGVVKKSKNHFCCTDCYMLFRKKEFLEKGPRIYGPKNMSVQNKLKMYAKKYKKLKRKELTTWDGI